MRILHLIFHPDIENSKVNRVWKEVFEESEHITTSRSLYSEYPDFKIDVEKEQQLLLKHDRIVLQFPLYWYSSPPLLKKWLDEVLLPGFAYGVPVTQLAGKELQIITSAGGQEKYYRGFGIYKTMFDLLSPFELTANLCQMKYLVPLWMFQADKSDLTRAKSYGKKWLDIVTNDKASEPRTFYESDSTFKNPDFS